VAPSLVADNVQSKYQHASDAHVASTAAVAEARGGPDGGRDHAQTDSAASQNDVVQKLDDSAVHDEMGSKHPLGEVGQLPPVKRLPPIGRLPQIDAAVKSNSCGQLERQLAVVGSESVANSVEFIGASMQSQMVAERSSEVPSSPSPYRDLGLMPRQGGLHSIHKVKSTATGVELAAKHFDHRSYASFHQERTNLRELMADRGGREYVTQLVDVDESTRILYLELALGSLDQQLDEQPGGAFNDVEVRLTVTRVLHILNYLHSSKMVAHNDVKVRLLLR
jgi:hypothetical protein